MGALEEKKIWEEYRVNELARAALILEKLGFTLDAKQVHTGGERYLMAGVQDVGGGGKKLVLTGERMHDHERVVIKFSTTPNGMREIERERTSRNILGTLNFALHTFSTPEEILYTQRDDYTLFITEYIAEQRTFMEHALDEQFFFALRALETQEGVHVTTSAHALKIKESFGMVSAPHYLALFETFRMTALANDPDNTELEASLTEAEAFLKKYATVIERYSGFLTHSDFSPQNLRIRNRTLYLLDYASMYFGNKYESWARFINFMTQHNPALERLLLTYVRENRGEEEYLCLRLMRVYKLGFLLQFWTATLDKTDGNLHELVRLRITFWTNTLRAVLDDTSVPEEDVRAYLEKQVLLRSDDENARQKEILAREHLSV